MKRGEQISVYMRADVKTRYSEFRKRYPNVTDSALINAALSFYIPHAERGIDGNLLPYTLETAPDVDHGIGQHAAPIVEMVRELVHDAMKQVTKGKHH